MSRGVGDGLHPRTHAPNPRTHSNQIARHLGQVAKENVMLSEVRVFGQAVTMITSAAPGLCGINGRVVVSRSEPLHAMKAA
jgi:hypothetical protein